MDNGGRGVTRPHTGSQHERLNSTETIMLRLHACSHIRRRSDKQRTEQPDEEASVYVNRHGRGEAKALQLHIQLAVRKTRPQ